MEPITKPIQPTASPHKEMWYRGPQTVPESGKYTTDKILEYIRSVNREEVARRRANWRDSRSVREEPRMEARVLHTAGATVYPTSLLYAPPSGANNRLRVEEGVRTPILQYAHPELGVQSALVSPSVDEEVDNIDYGRDKALAYFGHDIHSDRSPFAFEPGLEEEARLEDYSENDKRSNNGHTRPQHRPKKTLSYFSYQDQSPYHNNKYYGKYSYKKYNDYVDRRPFWEKISDSIKENVGYGMEKVQDLTRPVVEPLVEATHKISENLGLTPPGTRDMSAFKEKLGMASSGSMLLPAIGLVAGGAALGLGAVAVGRFLDVDMLKRSASGRAELQQAVSANEKRVLSAVAEGAARYRRSADLQELGAEKSWQQVPQAVRDPATWATTPCAKYAFCQVLTSQSNDHIDFMEKKMATYLKL
ncbi:hypothetical protein AAG570_008464 [Ranatra chinensis]|uniref:Uncharacterized protein n=1 Tax=Ranatra chinensis TaxID=642074 RepID=A0ABD0YR92_9HEMI